MQPDTTIVVVSLVFLAIVFGTHQLAATIQKKSGDEAAVALKKADVDAFKDMTDKAVRTIQALHGGVAGDAMRTIIDVPEERTHGNGGPVRYAQPASPQHRPVSAEAR